MAQRIVDRLEVVKVQDQQGEEAPVPPCTMDFLSDGFVEVPAVVYGGQFIDVDIAEEALKLRLGDQPNLPEHDIPG